MKKAIIIGATSGIGRELAKVIASRRYIAEKRKLNITVTDIQPGFVDTAMARGDHVFRSASTQKAAEAL